ncbi:MAG: hypothetical protein QOE53_1523, partial [Pseudonocardiales bacterium]|nr:hypothetical protein [Pseudonocardiales bacterium]
MGEPVDSDSTAAPTDSAVANPAEAT